MEVRAESWKEERRGKGGRVEEGGEGGGHKICNKQGVHLLSMASFRSWLPDQHTEQCGCQIPECNSS